jgi:hypothetical protein
MQHVSQLILLMIMVSLTSPVAWAADFASQVMNATFKLFNKDSTATCFILKRGSDPAAYFLVTAAHVLERASGDTAILVLRKSTDTGGFARVDFPITIRKDSTTLWTKHEKYDIAVLRLPQQLPVEVLALDEAVLAAAADLQAAKLHICSPLFVLTYPQRFEANSAGFPVARQGIWSSPPLLPISEYPTFLADFTTFAGDSGAPVFIRRDEEQPLVVGVVLAQNHFDDRVKSEYENRLIHYPLGMGTILHAQYIRDTLGKVE